MFFGPQEMCRWARDAMELPRIRRGGCSTIELGRHIEPATGVEPITCDNPQLRPIERPTDKRRTGDTCSTPELPRHLEPKAGLEPATSRVTSDNPILRPVESIQLTGGQEMTSIFRTGLEPASFHCSWNALALLSYRFDNRSTTARPKEPTDKGRDGNPAILAAGAGVEPARDFSLIR